MYVCVCVCVKLVGTNFEYSVVWGGKKIQLAFVWMYRCGFLSVLSVIQLQTGIILSFGLLSSPAFLGFSLTLSWPPVRFVAGFVRSCACVRPAHGKLMVVYSFSMLATN